MATKRGKFIVIEGGEGSGKDTQIDRLKQLAIAKQITFTREPGGTVLGEKIRAVLLSSEAEKMVTETELLLFVAARAQLVREVIEPTLRAGRHIISNRFNLSTLAYQIYGRQQSAYLPFLESLNQIVVGDCRPDLYILLDLDPVTGLARTAGRTGNNRLDREPLSFHQKVRQGYLAQIKNYPHLIIDSARPIKTVQAELKKAIEEQIILD